MNVEKHKPLTNNGEPKQPDIKIKLANVLNNAHAAKSRGEQQASQANAQLVGYLGDNEAAIQALINWSDRISGRSPKQDGIQNKG